MGNWKSDKSPVAAARYRACASRISNPKLDNLKLDSPIFNFNQAGLGLSFRARAESAEDLAGKRSRCMRSGYPVFPYATRRRREGNLLLPRQTGPPMCRRRRRLREHAFRIVPATTK